ncbi:MAG: hypothetical protein Q8O67_01130 [Deltaproteobacteria bacterium]|nr:hypothetical protein [Deltaproteobacteria bacterium]
MSFFRRALSSDGGAGLLADLTAAAAGPVSSRLAWLPIAWALLGDQGDDDDDDDPAARPDVALRVVCCRVLAGAVGRGAIEALVNALDDRSHLVREAAVAALSTSAALPGHGARLLHAAAHPRADVRRAAVLLDALPPTFLTFLLADPRVRDDARQRLQERAAREPEVGAVVVRARRQGLIDDDDARAALLGLPWSRAAQVLRALPTTQAPEPAVATSVDALLKHAVSGFDDALVDVLVLIGDDDGLARALATAAHRRALDDTDLLRLAVAVAVAALSRPDGVSPRLLATAAVGAPAVLALDGIEIGLRKAAARLLVEVGVARHEDPIAVLAKDPVLLAGEGYDVAAVAGVLRMCSERGYERMAKALSIEALVRSFSTSPVPALLSLPPSQATDRREYMQLVDRVLREWTTLAPTPSEIAAVVVTLPFDGARLLEELERLGSGTTLAVLTAVVDADSATAAGPIEEKRLARAAELLCARLDTRSAAGLLRVVATSTGVPGRSGRGGRAVVRGLCRCLDVTVIADIVDGMTEAHRAVVLPLLLDEAPPVRVDVGLRSLLPRSSSKTLQALLARGDGRRDASTLSDDEARALAVIADGHLAAALLQATTFGAIKGVADAVLGRRSVPRSVAVAAAILSSHDPISTSARAVALVLPEANAAERLLLASELRTTFALSALPLAARLFLVDDDAAALRIERDVLAAPGGLKAMIELALALPAPVDAALWHALAVVVRKVRHADVDAFARLVDARAIALLLDLERRDAELLPQDPFARAGADELLLQAAPALAPHKPATTTTTTTAPAAFPWADELLAEKPDALEALLKGLDLQQQQMLAYAALLWGIVPSARLLLLLGRATPPAWTRVRGPLVMEALRVVDGAAALTPLIKLLPLRLSTLSAVERLRDLFSWGARQSVAIVGRTLGMSLIGDALGYTRLKGSRVFVNPLPLLLGEEGGVDVVKGLIVHELGHHRYHADDAALAIWEQARTERLHKLLNLVADEHLERNLRAESARFGNPLKVLAAHAFQHMRKDVDVDVIVQAMGRRAFDVLSTKRLGVARRPGSVVLDVGSALFVLEKTGSSFARFMRALRMGLGDRYDDAKVRQALALFSGKQFRNSTMAELMAITRKLREIFADETRLLDAFDIHQLTDGTPDDVVGDGGVDVDELGRAVQEPQPRTRLKSKPGPASRGRRMPMGRVLNDSDDDEFDPITTIERVAFDATTHRALADQVRRLSQRLRQTLLNLGKNLVVERRRLSGRRVDTTALVGAVLRGDPRLLVSRRTLPAADLFLAVIIDCSGSMEGDNLERARLFAALIAEAARGLRGVDARFFGFTDEIIFDAGDARRCAVSGLVSDGGNNDAAALFHVAQVARRSRRRTRLLVMISDGSPTECSVTALSNLVVRLTRQGFLCAQVAVEEIEDICFPHYVLLDGDDMTGAVKAFAVVVERLVLLGTGGRR